MGIYVLDGTGGLAGYHAVGTMTDAGSGPSAGQETYALDGTYHTSP